MVIAYHTHKPFCTLSWVVWSTTNGFLEKTFAAECQENQRSSQRLSYCRNSESTLCSPTSKLTFLQHKTCHRMHRVASRAHVTEMTRSLYNVPDSISSASPLSAACVKTNKFNAVNKKTSRLRHEQQSLITDDE